MHVPTTAFFLPIPSESHFHFFTSILSVDGGAPTPWDAHGTPCELRHPPSSWSRSSQKGGIQDRWLGEGIEGCVPPFDGVLPLFPPQLDHIPSRRLTIQFYPLRLTLPYGGLYFPVSVSDLLPSSALDRPPSTRVNSSPFLASGPLCPWARSSRLRGGPTHVRTCHSPLRTCSWTPTCAPPWLPCAAPRREAHHAGAGTEAQACVAKPCPAPPSP